MIIPIIRSSGELDLTNSIVFNESGAKYIWVIKSEVNALGFYILRILIFLGNSKIRDA